MKEKLYNIQLTEKEIQVLNIGTAQFLRDLHTFVYKPFYVESAAEEHKPIDAQELKNLMLAKQDLDTLTTVLDKLEKVRNSNEVTSKEESRN